VGFVAKGDGVRFVGGGDGVGCFGCEGGRSRALWSENGESVGWRERGGR